MKRAKSKETNFNRIKIVIKNNKDSIIENNSIHIHTASSNFDINYQKDIDFTLRNSKKYDELILSKRIISGAFERNLFLKDTFNRFIFISKANNFCPTIRVCGYFTSLSSIRQKTETTDLAFLELEEKDNLIKMIKLGFEVKLVLILDVRTILNLGYSLEQYNERCQDLYRSIELLEEKHPNMKIVVNDKNNITCGYILDSILLIQTEKFDLDSVMLSYNNTYVDSRDFVIKNEIDIFDNNFNRLSFKLAEAKSLLQSPKTSDSILSISKIRRDNYLNVDK